MEKKTVLVTLDNNKKLKIKKLHNIFYKYYICIFFYILMMTTDRTDRDRTGPTIFGQVLGLGFWANSVSVLVCPVRSGTDAQPYDDKPNTHAK